MIQLDELTLKNYKCHRSLKLKFGPGVTGIVGDNGSGKSSVISAIRFLFTGEVDTESKQESVTLGETEGWVSGKLTLNDKEAYLERHLSTSKVILRYDGVSYNKAAEVKELWSRLLQIDNSIFNNVIIAAQGDIPLLFSGDASVREKVFQKIFLVPPTEKLRSVIWDHYIKTCPPEKFEEDVSLLQSEETNVASRRNKILAEIDLKTSVVINESFLKCVLERIAFLEKCQRDLLERPKLLTQAEVFNNQLMREEAMVALEQATTKDVDFANLKLSYEHMLAQKNLAKHKLDLEHELFVVESRAPTEAEVKQQREQLERVSALESEARDVLTHKSLEVTRLTAVIDKLAKLEGYASCPTCNQTLEDCQQAIDHQKDELFLAKRDAATANAKYMLIHKQFTREKTDLSCSEGQLYRVLNIKQQLARYDQVTYSEDELAVLGEAVKAVERSTATIRQLELSIQKAKGQLDVIAEKMSNLAAYDGSASIVEELGTMNSVIAENRHRISELEALRVNQAKLEHELQLLEQRIETSLVNHKSNEKRSAYLEKMQKAYDILHVSKFPRKLIESYSEYVQVHLSSYLEKFNIPYKGKIAEGFKIKMINEDGRDLPSVSGGQEVIAGICLRLALHKMFAQSFPIWIVDEGTTHLSETNKKAYFKLIEEIRTNKIVNQVLIIDHDSQLAAVVDKTIQL